AADIGRALGTVAHLETLRRTAVGAFRVEQATSLDALAAVTTLPIVPVRDALGGYAAYPTSPEVLASLRRGQQHPLTHLPSPRRAGETALLLDGAGRVAGVIESRGGDPGWRLVRLLAIS